MWGWSIDMYPNFLFIYFRHLDVLLPEKNALWISFIKVTHILSDIRIYKGKFENFKFDIQEQETKKDIVYIDPILPISASWYIITRKRCWRPIGTEVLIFSIWCPEKFWSNKKNSSIFRWEIMLFKESIDQIFGTRLYLYQQKLRFKFL